MSEYQRKPFPFAVRGMSIAASPDRLPDGLVSHIQNLRCIVQGEWRQRPGLALIGDLNPAAANPVTSIFSVSDVNVSSIFAATSEGNLYRTSGSPLAVNQTPIAQGFGSTPISCATSRPDRSPNSFGFLSNAWRTAKVSAGGAVTDWGLGAPTQPVTSEVTRLAYQTVEEFNSATGFTASSGTLTTPDRLNSASVAIDALAYDTASPQQGSPTGWVSIIPAAAGFTEAIQSGMFITVTAGQTSETSVVGSVYPEITSTTIQQIAYDSGTTGLCTIQLSASSSNLRPNAIIYLQSTVNNVTTQEYTRVLSVTPDLTGVPSIRVKTLGTHVAGATVTGKKSFRIYLATSFTTPASLSATYMNLALANAGLTTITKTANLDLSTVSLGATSRPTQPEDLIHLSLQVSDFSKVSEIQLQFDCDSTTNDFTRNYFFRSIRPPDIQAAINQTASSLTAQQKTGDVARPRSHLEDPSTHCRGNLFVDPTVVSIERRQLSQRRCEGRSFLDHHSPVKSPVVLS